MLREQVCNAHVSQHTPEVVGAGDGDLRDAQFHLAARGRGEKGKQMRLDVPVLACQLREQHVASQPDTCFLM